MDLLIHPFNDGPNRFQPMPTERLEHQHTERVTVYANGSNGALHTTVETACLFAGTNLAEQMDSGDVQLHLRVAIARRTHCNASRAPGQTFTAMAAIGQHQLHRLTLFDADTSWSGCGPR